MTECGHFLCDHNHARSLTTLSSWGVFYTFLTPVFYVDLAGTCTFCKKTPVHTYRLSEQVRFADGAVSDHSADWWPALET